MVSNQKLFLYCQKEITDFIRDRNDLIIKNIQLATGKSEVENIVYRTLVYGGHMRLLGTLEVAQLIVRGVYSFNTEEER